MEHVILLHRLNSLISGTLGTVLNGSLLYITYRSSSSAGFQQYNTPIIQTCVIDLAFSLWLFLANPIIVLRDFSEYVIYNGFLLLFEDFPVDWKRVLTAFWAFFLQLSLCSVAIGFVYRYRLICHGLQYTLSFFLVSISLSIAVAIGFGAVIYWAYMIMGQPYVERIDMLLPYLNDKNDTTMTIGMLKAKTLQYLLVNVYTIIVNGIIYAMIVYCSLKVKNVMKDKFNNTKPSKKTAKLHAQISRTLIIQATIPLLTTLVPMSMYLFVVVCPALDGVAVSALATLALSWIPMGNALAVILSVKSYRKRLPNLSTVKKTFYMILRYYVVPREYNMVNV